jgi:hypothetical protein
VTLRTSLSCLPPGVVRIIGALVAFGLVACGGETKPAPARSGPRDAASDVTDAASTDAASADASQTEAGDAEPSDARADAPFDPDVPVSWCAAYTVINCVCQQCHRDPPRNSAPFPLMSYPDTQAPYGNRVVWQAMLNAVQTDYMPFQGFGDTITPPVKPLTPARKNTLLGWLEQGAQTVGGESCPMTCDWDLGPPDGG